MSSQQRASQSTRPDRLQIFESQPVQITSRSRPASRTRPNCIQPVVGEQARLDRLQTFESQPVQIASNNQRASPSRSYLASREPARPDRIQPTHLDRFQQVESQPTQIASSQLELLTNSCFESHTQPQRHSSLIMTDKEHLPTNEHSVICHSKMVHTTINQ